MAKTRLYEDEARGQVEHAEHVIVEPPQWLAVVLKDGAQDDAKTHASQAREYRERRVKRPRRHLGLDDVRKALGVSLKRGRAKAREDGAPTAHVLVGIVEHERA
jgi:hypothetical protein